MERLNDCDMTLADIVSAVKEEWYENEKKKLPQESELIKPCENLSGFLQTIKAIDIYYEGWRYEQDPDRFEMSCETQYGWCYAHVSLKNEESASLIRTILQNDFPGVEIWV